MIRLFKVLQVGFTANGRYIDCLSHLSGKGHVSLGRMVFQTLEVVQDWAEFSPLRSPRPEFQTQKEKQKPEMSHQSNPILGDVIDRFDYHQPTNRGGKKSLVGTPILINHQTIWIHWATSHLSPMYRKQVEENDRIREERSNKRDEGEREMEGEEGGGGNK